MGSELAPETVGDAQRQIALALKSAGIVGAAGDARRLIAAATALTLADLIGDPSRGLSADEAGRLADMTRRRLAREPVSRILGEREFYGRRFVITPAVLDPRPDTETLIEASLAIGRAEGWFARPITILDLGTGSGAILLTLLAEFPRATGTGIDVSESALACASANAHALGLASRCRFEREDMAAANLAGYDLVVSNPPYITTVEIETLDPEVADYDPRVALDGGADGLAFYRQIVSRLTGVMPVSRLPRWLVLEIGVGQADQVIGIAHEKGFSTAPDRLHLTTDLSGHIRCIAIKTQ